MNHKQLSHHLYHCHCTAADVSQKPIFHKVREQRHLLAKVSAVTGDLTQPGLGLAAGAAQQLQQQLQLILHCAADIRLEVSRQTQR